MHFWQYGLSNNIVERFRLEFFLGGDLGNFLRIVYPPFVLLYVLHMRAYSA